MKNNKQIKITASTNSAKAINKTSLSKTTTNQLAARSVFKKIEIQGV